MKSMTHPTFPEKKSSSIWNEIASKHLHAMRLQGIGWTGHFAARRPGGRVASLDRRHSRQKVQVARSGRHHSPWMTRLPLCCRARRGSYCFKRGQAASLCGGNLWLQNNDEHTSKSRPTNDRRKRIQVSVPFTGWFILQFR